MRLLIVDDEVATVQILLKAINWKEIGIGEVFTAYNASAAKNVLLRQRIDIIVSDIEMPQETGLELIEWVQGVRPDVVNIILTGYADFSYARSAVSLNVYRFILKPVDHAELIGVVSEAIKVVEQKRSMEKLRKIGAYFQDKRWTEELIDDNGQNLKPDVERIKAYMEKHYQDDITREDIEELVHLNRDYINRVFKEETGYTLMEYIQFFRIQVAKKWLLESRESVTAISTRVGYDSPAYFSKVFKKWTGVTPVAYRFGKEKRDS